MFDDQDPANFYKCVTHNEHKVESLVNKVSGVATFEFHFNFE